MLSFLTTMIPAIGRVIEKVVPDKDLREQLKAELLEQMLDQNSDLFKAQASIIRSEAKSESWLARSWRPISMLSFLALLFTYWLGFAPDYVVTNPDLVAELFGIIKVGIGGYIGSRGIEKVTKTIAEAGGVKKMIGG